METFATIFEIVMVLCFGASWPFNIIRAYKARTAKGTSLQFTILIGIGYVGAGYRKPLTILAFIFYFINLAMIITAIIIYFRNRKLDAAKAAAKTQETEA